MTHLMSALFDFCSLLTVALMFICTTTFARSLYPSVFGKPPPPGQPQGPEDSGVYLFCWKASRIGERVSEYVAAGCILMAIHVLFIKE